MLIEHNRNGSFAISHEIDGHVITRQFYDYSKCEAAREFIDEFNLNYDICEFEFADLDDDAKEKAREWWRDCESRDFDPEYVYDDAVRAGAIIGIDIDTRVNRGATYSRPSIYYSGFWSQGDGACFEGSYSYVKGSAKLIREYAPQDTELHGIADRLAAIQKRNFYSLSATTRHSGHYYHSGCMSVDVEDSRHCYGWLSDDSAESDITDELRAFADWIYSKLESEYEYRMSDESVDESISINEYKFTCDGELI